MRRSQKAYPKTTDTRRHSPGPKTASISLLKPANAACLPMLPAKRHRASEESGAGKAQPQRTPPGSAEHAQSVSTVEDTAARPLDLDRREEALAHREEDAERRTHRESRPARAAHPPPAQMARTVFAVLACATAVAAFSAPRAGAKAPVAVPKIEANPLAVAAALPAVAAPLAANAFQGSMLGLPVNVVVAFAPVLLLAVPWVLIVIAPGALQQLGRIQSGQSSKYFGEN